MYDYGAKEIAQAKAQFDAFYLEKRSADALRHLEEISQNILN